MDRSGIVVTGVTSMLLRDAMLCCAVLCCAVLAARAMRDDEIMMCLEKRSGIWVQDPIRRCTYGTSVRMVYGYSVASS